MTLADLKGLKQVLCAECNHNRKYFVPRLLGTFRLVIQASTFLCKSRTGSVLERLSENLDDLYILGQPPASLDINLRPENPVVIAPQSSSGARKIFPYSALPKPFIMREPGSGTRMTVERFFNENRVAIKVEMEIGSNEAIKRRWEA